MQRLVELILAKRNENKLKAKGALEFDRNGYRVIVAMHFAFFLCLVIEKVTLQRGLSKFWVAFLILFFIAQFLRYWAITTLGINWNTKVLVLPSHEITTKGPYRYLRHPNYIAVIIEIASIPLIFSCYITALVFSILNLVLLRRRIKIEESVLKKPQLVKIS
ncbi:MAG: isoprenylcysteine carboxyl methyltransferase family protein [Thermodesulfobacteriota bacterium]